MIYPDFFRGKKLLVLGGTAQQVKFVEAARHMGVFTIVVDYLNDSPAKLVADKACLIDIKDVDRVVEFARQEKIDGVVCGYIDPAQRPYQEICAALNVPCYGTREQFRYMTDKNAFKDLCHRHGVDTIPSYSENDLCSKSIDFPVFVKPVDSRGSRGQKACFDYEELTSSIALAKSESSNGDVIIEKYLKGYPEFQVTYFFVDGEPYILRTADSYTGSSENGLDKVVLAALSPSLFTDLYLRQANTAVVSMLQSIGFKNGPAFMQGFIDGDKFRFFDPGLRLPGVDYDRILSSVFGIDIAAAMVVFALTGKMPIPEGIEGALRLNGSAAAVLFPVALAGEVGDISSLDSIADMCGVVSCIPRVKAGDVIEKTGDINQRIAEIDLVADDRKSLLKLISEVENTFEIRSTTGARMDGEKFDVHAVCERVRVAGGSGE